MNLQQSEPNPHFQSVQDIDGHRGSPLPEQNASDAAEKIAVLLSKHPCQRNLHAAAEIHSLRRLGYEIELSALQSTLQDPAGLGPEMKAEIEATHYVRTRSGLKTLACHLRGLFSPLPYFRLVSHVIRIDGWSGLVRSRHVADVLNLACWMRSNGIRHLHAHFGTDAARVAILMKHLLPGTVSLTLGNSDDLHHAGPARLKEEVEAANFIICVGTGSKSALMHLTPSHLWHKYEVSSPGIDTLRFKPRPQRSRSLMFTVLCVGGLEANNGQRTLLEACRLLKASGREIRLILIGDGDDEAELKTRIWMAGMEDSVAFVGSPHEELLCYWYNRADVFVNCSLSGGLSLPVMEAMASGLACVSSRTIGMLELIREGSDGLLVEPDNEHELAGALLRLMDDDVLRARLAGYGRARILQKYSLSRTSERFGNLFHSRLSSNSTHRKRHASAHSFQMKHQSEPYPAD